MLTELRILTGAALLVTGCILLLRIADAPSGAIARAPWSALVREFVTIPVLLGVFATFVPAFVFHAVKFVVTGSFV